MPEQNPTTLNKMSLFVKNKDLALQKEVMELNDNLKGIKDAIDRPTPVQINGVELVTLKGDKGDKGEKGERGEMGPMGPQGIQGKEGAQGPKGDMGPIGPRGIDGINGTDGKDGVDGKDGNIKDLSPEEIRDALELLIKGEKLSIQAIEGLTDILEDLKKKATDLGGGGGFTSPVYNFVDDETPTGTINGTNTVFVLRKLPYRGSVKVYRGGTRQRVTEDYTLSSDQKTITFTIAPQVGEVILVDYRTL